MTLPVWVTSPVPAPLTREPLWNENAQFFDSGARQGATPYLKPLYRYGFNSKNMQRTKQSSLFNFFAVITKGMTKSFLFMDPYDNSIGGTVCVNTGTNATTFYVYDVNSFSVIPASGSYTITSALSGALLPNVHFVMSQDNGFVTTVLTPSNTDFWTASGQYYRKCAFEKQYSEQSPLWNSFDVDIIWREHV